MAIIWGNDDTGAKRCYKVYRSGEYKGTHLLTVEQVKELRSNRLYEVRPSYWVEVR